jgi:trigger factor
MTQIKKLEKSRVEIESSIEAKKFESWRKKALENINNEITVDGFRKGKVPENILVSKVGEMNVLEEMAELAINEAYPKILIEEKIDAIGRPEIHITKLAKDNPLEFKIITAIVPEVKIADYKKISKDQKAKKEKIEDVTEKEIEEAILNIRRSRVDHKGHDHEKMNAEEHQKLVDASLPEFNDSFVQSLGDFKNISDFKEKLKEMITEEKKEKAKEKRRIAISDKLIEETVIDLPDVFVESEMRRIESQFSDDIARMGVKLEDYLKHAKKTIEDLRLDWKPHAEKKAKLQLILNEISKLEKIIPDEKEVQNEVDHILEHYKDADKEQVRVYAETILMNEKVFQSLEK